MIGVEIPHTIANVTRPVSTTPITELLRRWSGGDAVALEKMLPIVYQELRKLASGYLKKERAGHLLRTTALVHEAYLRLVDQPATGLESRSHFYGIAARVMRQVLVDHARREGAGRRGGGALKLTLGHAADVPAPSEGMDFVALDGALDRLAEVDSRQARLVELRYFGGLTIEETAEVMNLSPATVKREWTSARAWLFKELSQH
jgi:RNA polymerase sigma factor (TIGR02999 family)